MSADKPCVCDGGSTLVFSCSGAADVGAVADQAARALSDEGVGTMFCLAGVGGKVEPILDKTRAAARLVAIDGCPLDCTKHCLDKAGFTDFVHLRVTDLGMAKGRTPVTPDSVARVVAHIKSLGQPACGEGQTCPDAS